MQVFLHPSDQPVFRLAVRSSQCMVELRVNDVPVFCEVTGTALSLDLPLNEWLFQGMNVIQVLLSPLEEGSAFGSEAAIEATLQHKFARDSVRNVSDIGVLQWKTEPELPHGHLGFEEPAGPDSDPLLEDADEDAPLLALPGQAEELNWRIGSPKKLRNKSVRISSILLLPPPWPACPWARSQSLPDDPRTLFAVQGLVRAYHQRLQFGGYEDLVNLRRQALEAAYYIHGEDADEALGFPALLKRSEWVLQPLPEQGLRLELAGQGRLARLLDESTAESPLVLVNESEGVAAVLDAWWMFNGEWLLVR